MKWQSFKCHSNLAIHVFCSYTTSFPFPPPIPLQKEIYFRYSKKNSLGPSFFQLKCVMEVWRHNIVRKCIQFNPCKCLNIVMGSWEIQLISLLISDTYKNKIMEIEFGICFLPFQKHFFCQWFRQRHVGLQGKKFAYKDIYQVILLWRLSQVNDQVFISMVFLSS